VIGNSIQDAQNPLGRELPMPKEPIAVPPAEKPRPAWMRHIAPIMAIVVGIAMFAAMFAFRDFVPYLQAVLTHWVALMSGGVSVLVTFYQQIRKTAGKYVLYVVAAMCVFFAGFQAWQDQYALTATTTSENTNLHKQLDALDKPDLKAEIDEFVTGRVALAFENGKSTTGPASVLIVMSIRNLGADSIAEGYNLQVFGVDGGFIGNGTMELLPDNFKLGYFKVTNDQLLTNKSEEIPIPRGGSRKGYLFFVIENVDVSLLQRMGTKFVVSFKDVTGRPYSVESVVTHHTLSKNPSWYPGTDFPPPISKKTHGNSSKLPSS
jgi:hypothetical protein